MKKVFIVLFMLPSIVFAQYNIIGKITDAQSNETLPGASIQILNTLKVTLSNTNGNYELKNIKAGGYEIKVSFIGYESLVQKVNITTENVTLNFIITKKGVMADEVVIAASRADDKTPTTFANLSKEQLEKNNLGQDLPYLLNQTPSTVVTSDAGAGVGYTGIRIRGTDATRINVTINGIPVNDAESQGVFFVDMPDLASSVDNIQIQRGVGTSANGAGAFGASINIQTNKLNPDAYAEINSSFGSFNTYKNTVKFGTGLLNNKIAVDARLSQITSDGFIDRASSNLKSYYISGAYYGKKSILRFTTFAGKEITYQAWNGIPEAKLRGDTKTINEFAEANYLDAEDTQNLLKSSNRTYNQFTYQNQVDNYYQDNYQLHYSKEISKKLNANIALHGTSGKGYYEEYKKQEAFANYSLSDVVIGNDTITNTDLIRRKWLDNVFYGTVFSINYNASNKLNFSLGGSANQYKGAHYGEIIWAQYTSNSYVGQRYYRDDATKNDMNVYLRTNYQLTNKINAWLDLQYRTVSYSFLGFNTKLQNVQQTASLNFINPKAGLSYKLNGDNYIYASYSIGNKEPNRDDYTQSTPASRPLAETLNNTEIGYRYNRQKLNMGINIYDMQYKNQLVITGKLNDVGAYTRTNIAQSYRRGIEIDGSVYIAKWLRWAANATLSENKIKNFTEFLDDYDNGGQVVIAHPNATIAFSPSVIASSTISFIPLKGLELDVVSKYVGKQYLDNTMNESKKLNAFFVNNIRLAYTISNKAFFKQIQLTALLNNVLDARYENNGYTYSYIYVGQTSVNNFYYPQAGRNFMIGLSLKF